MRLEGALFVALWWVWVFAAAEAVAISSAPTPIMLAL